MNLTILFVEDDEVEIMKFSRVLNKMPGNYNVLFAKNGEEALAEAKGHSPNLIILDLNMPKMSGLEFLTTIKQDSDLKFIPTVILTTSNNHLDMLQAYNLGIAGYFIKPLRYEAYGEQLEKIVSYWCANEFVKQ